MIDIVIVNWNAGAQLQDCIESVRNFHDGLLGKCIVVDNGSTDGSTDFLLNAHDVDLVLTGQNLGFAKACNLGAARGSADMVLFLNPDARLLPHSLTGAQSFLQDPENESVGIVGVQLIGEDGAVQRTCARTPTPFRILSKSLGLTAIFKSTDFQMGEWAHTETRKVDQVIGAFFLIRRTLFCQLNGLDERFFMYFEEVDLSYRAAQLGHHSLYVADVQAFHKGNGVSEQVKAHRLFYSLRSRILYAFKHFSNPAALLIATATLAVEPFSRLVFLLLRGRVGEIRDLGRGYQMLWGWALSRLTRDKARG